MGHQSITRLSLSFLSGLPDDLPIPIYTPGPVVQRADNTIWWINNYPVDNSQKKPTRVSTSEQHIQWIVLPTLQITGAWLQRDIIKVKYSAQEHNTMTWPGLIPRPPTQTSRQGFQCTDCKAKIFVTSSLKQEHMMFFFFLQ